MCWPARGEVRFGKSFVYDGGADCVAGAAVFAGQVSICDSFGCNWGGGADGGAGIFGVVPATLLTRARAIMAADVSARMFQQPTPEQQRSLDEIAATGVEITPVTELLSMASAAKTMDPLLVSLKAVDPARYPFYGTVDLEPAGRLGDVLRPDTVVVADDLLVRLRLHVGDELKLGNKLFRIASVVANEPDRLSGSFAAGPRVLISREGLESSGLLAPGSHAGQRYLFKVPAPGSGAGDLRQCGGGAEGGPGADAAGGAGD